jgi:thiamine transport system substrate-binding protein
VFPVRRDVTLPEVFTRYSVSPADVAELPADEVGANRADWIDEWTDLVVR